MENEQFSYEYFLDEDGDIKCTDEHDAEEQAKDNGNNSYWEFKCAPVDAGEVFNVENMLEDIDARLYHKYRNVSSVFSLVTDDEIKELNDLVRAWIKNHAHVNFSKIVQRKEIFIISAEKWNKNHPVGTPVAYRPILDDEKYILTKTRSEAWNLGSGAPVVKIEGRTGGVLLEAISLLPNEK